jgi:alkylated DNA nucleotide flippase Atl1
MDTPYKELAKIVGRVLARRWIKAILEEKKSKETTSPELRNTPNQGISENNEN